MLGYEGRFENAAQRGCRSTTVLIQQDEEFAAVKVAQCCVEWSAYWQLTLVCIIASIMHFAFFFTTTVYASDGIGVWLNDSEG